MARVDGDVVDSLAVRTDEGVSVRELEALARTTTNLNGMERWIRPHGRHFHGTLTIGDSGDAGPAVNAELHLPVASAVDKSGNLYIGEDNSSSTQFTNNTIRKVAPAWIISTIAAEAHHGA